jgi:hypothetical protein
MRRGGGGLLCRFEGVGMAGSSFQRTVLPAYKYTQRQHGGGWMVESGETSTAHTESGSSVLVTCCAY